MGDWDDYGGAKSPCPFAVAALAVAGLAFVLWALAEFVGAHR